MMTTTPFFAEADVKYICIYIIYILIYLLSQMVKVTKLMEAKTFIKNTEKKFVF